MTNEQLLSEWLLFGRSFSGPTGAILAHGRDCRFYALLSSGGKPKDGDCTCKAATASRRLLWLVQETKAKVDEAGSVSPENCTHAHHYEVCKRCGTTL